MSLCSLIQRTRDLGRKFWWCCALCAVPPAARRSGGRHWCGAERFLSGEPQSPPAAAFNSPGGAGLDPGTLGDSCALCRRVTTPGPAACGNHLKAGACAGDGLTQQLKGSHSPHHRARALQQECRMPHCDIMPHCDKMPQLHRFSSTAIEYSMVHSEDAVSTEPDLF